MARSHLTLAALATSAVDGLDVTAASGFGSASGGDFDSALITGADGRHWVVRVPTSPRAETEQSADLVALRAMSVGIRNRLPFTVSAYAGQCPAGGTRAVVYEFVYGSKLGLADLRADALAASVGEALASIHLLPTSFVTDAGLPVNMPHDTLRSTITLMDRASATNLVPSGLLSRWEGATADSALWQFAPTVVNGDLAADSFLQADGKVSGVIGWQSLSVGDPARDLCWLYGSTDDEAIDAVVGAYSATRAGGDRQLSKRARLYGELEIAKWLLHGTQSRDTSIVDDAVRMLHGLVDRVDGNLDQTVSHNTLPVMTVDEVESMLDNLPKND